MKIGVKHENRPSGLHDQFGQDSVAAVEAVGKA